jgi:hypothetical protein
MNKSNTNFEVITERHDLPATHSIVARVVAHVSVVNAGEPLSMPWQITDRTRNLGLPLPLFEARVKIAEAAAQIRATIHNKLHEPIGD